MKETWRFIKYSFIVIFLGVFIKTQWDSFKKFESNDVVLVNSVKNFDDMEVLPEV